MPKRLFDGRIEADVLLRAIAISIVVFNHAFYVEHRPFEVNGGMNVLVLLSGVTFARFTLTKSTAADVRQSILSLTINLIGPCLAMLIPYFILHRELRLSEIAFYQNLIDRHQFAPYISWYPQAIIQLMILLIVLISVPPLFRAMRRDPLIVSIVATLVFAAVRLFAIPYWSWGPIHHTPIALLWQFALGWVVYFAARGREAAGVGLRIGILSMTAGLAYVGFATPDGPLKQALMLGAVATLLFARRIPLPRPAVAAASIVSQATYTIFLFHTLFLGMTKTLHLRMYTSGFHLWDNARIWLVMMLGPILLWILFASVYRAWRESIMHPTSMSAPAR